MEPLGSLLEVRVLLLHCTDLLSRPLRYQRGLNGSNLSCPFLHTDDLVGVCFHSFFRNYMPKVVDLSLH